MGRWITLNGPVPTASHDNHDFLHKLGAGQVVDHHDPDWPNQVRDMSAGGVHAALACVRINRSPYRLAGLCVLRQAVPVITDFPKR